MITKLKIVKCPYVDNLKHNQFTGKQEAHQSNVKNSSTTSSNA